jgi:glycosyltransferase involved in cell wall biosynthesis
MSKKINLLIVASFPSKNKMVVGGIEKSSRILVRSKYFKQFNITRFDTSQISNPPPNFLTRLVLALFRLYRFTKIFIRKKPDTALIFCSDGASAIEKGLMLIICRFFNVKSLIFPRAGNLITQTNKNTLFKGLIKYLFSYSNIFLCQGPSWYSFAVESLKIEKSNVFIVNNWTASKDLLAVGKNRIISEKVNNLEILYVGWLEKQKGINELLESFLNLVKNYDIKIKFVGDGTLRRKIKEISINNKIQNNISLTGWLSDQEIITHLKSSDIFVLPSWYEGMPNSLIEALASGLPSICSSVGIIPDYVIDGVNGLLIQPNDKLNLEKTIEKTINDINLRKRISKNGVNLAENIFSEDVSLNKLSSIIKKLSNG